MNTVIFQGILLIIAIYISYLIWTFRQNPTEFCTIETSHGPVRGKQNRTLFEKKSFYSFRGIPFAKPPIGELRFKVEIESLLHFQYFKKKIQKFHYWEN